MNAIQNWLWLGYADVAWIKTGIFQCFRLIESNDRRLEVSINNYYGKKI